MTTQQRIFEYIRTKLNPSSQLQFDPTQNLMGAGILDSLAMMDLIVWLEQTFSITVDTDDLVPENFATLDAMTNSSRGDLASAVRDLFASPYDGRVKLWVVRQALRARREHCALFRSGDYTPLTVKGELSDHVVAFARRHEGDVAIVVAARMFASLVNEPGTLPVGEAVWGDTALSLELLPHATKLVNVLTGKELVAGKEIALSSLFAHFPAALLHHGDLR